MQQGGALGLERAEYGAHLGNRRHSRKGKKAKREEKGDLATGTKLFYRLPYPSTACSSWCSAGGRRGKKHFVQGSGRKSDPGAWADWRRKQSDWGGGGDGGAICPELAGERKGETARMGNAGRRKARREWTGREGLCLPQASLLELPGLERGQGRPYSHESWVDAASRGFGLAWRFGGGLEHSGGDAWGRLSTVVAIVA